MNRREFLAAGLAATPLFRCAALPVVAAREPLALATADTDAHVVAVSLATHRVVRRVPTIEGPRSIQAGPGGVAIVGHSAAGAVTLLEGRPRVCGGCCAGSSSRATPSSRPATPS